jgi:cysteinyl-tRNA synthetase
MLHFFNSLTHRRDEFVPLESGKVGMYICGPTIYAPPHIGNLRTFFFADLLHRYLEFRGYEVKFVMNLTDVDDKTIAGATREGVSLREYTDPFERNLFENFDAMGIERADAYPRATEYLPQMVELIGRLIEKGLAYESDGSVYYDISEFPEYGKLSRVDLEQGRRGERVASDEYDRGDVRDFALWKAAKPEDEQVGAVWDTPWGPGRPGWHIECSAMSMGELGSTFDIHGGGVDLLFPHHEDEIAQSEGATGQPFARFWLHAEHMQVDGEKMAKSTGKMLTLDDLAERGVRPSSIRYTFLTAHYRTKLNFTWEAIESGAEAVRRLRATSERLREEHPMTAHPRAHDEPRLHDASARALADFTEAMDDDLNTSVAVSAVWALAREINSRLDELGTQPITQAEAESALDALDRMDRVLGVIGLATKEQEKLVNEELESWVEESIVARREARKARDFARADQIREELAARGIVLEDTATGTRWKLVDSRI